MGRKPKTTVWSLKDEEEANMKIEQNEETKQEEVKAVQQAVINPHNVKFAYSMIENEGKYHVISVEFDPNSLVSGKVFTNSLRYSLR